jgi:hypothetical protein
VAEPIETQDDLTAARLARNEATFREANEKIERPAEAEGAETLIPFLCECWRRDCVEIVRLDLTEYEAVRSRPTQFLTAPGHALLAPGFARVVREAERYTIAEKLGVAGAVATETDSRGQ